jgi:hypothetical protein
MFKFFLNKNKAQNAEQQKSPEAKQDILHISGNGTQPLKTPPLDSEILLQWKNRIAEAAQDDAMLLKLSHEAPNIELKLSALQFIIGESTLKQAMHDFRDHDKRLYRAAKTKWDTAKAKRNANETAQKLINTARELLEQKNVAVNHAVELERSWKAAQQELVDDELSSEFSRLTEQLAEKIRRQSEADQTAFLWLNKIKKAQTEFKKCIHEIAQGNSSGADFDSTKTELIALLEQYPEHQHTNHAAVIKTTRELLWIENLLLQKILFLDALPEAGSATQEKTQALKNEWRNLKDSATDKHANLYEASERTFNAWLDSNKTLLKKSAETKAQQEREQRAQENTQRRETLQQHIQEAEAALTDGHTAELSQLLSKIDSLLHSGPTSANLNQRIDFLRRELFKLKDWQRWSGGKSREQLTEEATTLAQQAIGKVDLKAHADAIQKLRAQWKAVDKLGGGSNQSLWQQFDEALKQAYAPIAAQIEKRAAARQENLTLRELIISKLVETKAQLLPSTEHSSDTPVAVDWRAVIHAIEHAQIEWRKLGPVEHALPKEAVTGDNAITTRYASALEALEAPLRKIQNEALRQRRKIIQNATTLGTTDLLGINLVDKVRQLQTQWQITAKELPLFRHEENQLWKEFKTATDALFKTRDDARAQNEAAIQQQIKAREALIERLTNSLTTQVAADIRKVINETEKAWREFPSLPKPLENKLTSRLRDAKNKLQHHINHLERQANEARYNALELALSLCEERENLCRSNQDTKTEQLSDLQQRWNENEHLPDHWRTALATRFNSDKPLTNSQPEFNLLNALLNLESACGIDSPDEFITERQQLKMLQLKQALEKGNSTQFSMNDIDNLLLQVAAQPNPENQTRSRINKIIQALKNR